MAESTIWWLITGAFVALELVTGTFYLLMLAVGMAAAALAAQAGAGIVLQLLVAALVGGGAVVVWYQVKKRKPTDPSARADRSVNLDVGEIVQIDAWNPDGAIHRSGAIPSTGAHRVSELVGSRLLVDKV